MSRPVKLRLAFIAGVLCLLCSCEEDRYALAPRRCVDGQGRVIEDKYCESDETDFGYGTDNYVYVHHWYYGGEPGWIPYGRPVFGGTYIRPYQGSFYRPTQTMAEGRTVYSTDHVVTSGATTITRGVFGSTAAHFASPSGGGE